MLSACLCLRAEWGEQERTPLPKEGEVCREETMLLTAAMALAFTLALRGGARPDGQGPRRPRGHQDL
jgi:hypothetical protein